MLRKVLLLLLCCQLAAAVPSQAQTDCADYQLLRENTKYELLNYDRKDRQTGRIVYNVTNVENSGDKVEATIHSQVYDEEGKLATENDFKIGCENGSISMDLNSLMGPNMMGTYKEMEMAVEGNKLLYPSNLQAGQKLEDGTMTMEMKDKESGQKAMTMVMKVTNRTVEGKESVTVPAGTYDSYKIRYNTDMENRAMEMKMPGMRMETVEYYVPEIGTVRTETYRNGKLLSYTVLSKVE
ncbi:hypothetical protein [Pontibacter litorisediminis]|uniref:TapB family protein n=1 Tax=Pontibacter litorisediminis TaxID=1846260 RepID=UPI0023EC7DAA|nr:hypothetical protein [Pontibacter litorisediminis]